MPCSEPLAWWERLPDINARNKMYAQAAERTAINAPMQGTAADIIKRAMLAVDGWLRQGQTDAHMIMQARGSRRAVAELV